MSDDVNTGAAPSAVQEVSSQEVLNRMTPEERTNWRNTGNFPEAKPKSEVPAPSDAAKEQKTEGKPESASASEAETRQEKGKKLSADERIAQLEKTIEKIREGQKKQAPAEKEAAPATAKPEVKTEAKREAPKKPVRPDMKDFPVSKYETAEKAYEAYDAADRKYFDDLDKYHEEMRAWDRDETIRKFREDSQREAAQQKFNEYLKEAAQRYPKLQETLPVFVKEMDEATNSLPEPLKPYVPIFSQMLNSSAVLADVLMVIAGDEKTKSEFLSEISTNPSVALRRFIHTEKLVIEELDKAQKKADSTEKDPPATKKTTGAPPPPTEVSGTGTAPADDLEAAVKSGDFVTYKKLMNRREQEARKAN